MLQGLTPVHSHSQTTPSYQYNPQTELRNQWNGLARQEGLLPSAGLVSHSVASRNQGFPGAVIPPRAVGGHHVRGYFISLSISLTECVVRPRARTLVSRPRTSSGKLGVYLCTAWWLQWIYKCTQIFRLITNRSSQLVCSHKTHYFPLLATPRRLVVVGMRTSYRR